MKSMLIVLLFTFYFIVSAPHASAATSTPAEIEIEVRNYFKDVPVMIEIARCESKFRQFNDSGSVLRGGSAGGMIGIFQFFESIHAPAARKLGFDLETVDGNLAYARHLYKTQGTTPWASAKDCWETVPATSTSKDTTREKLQQQIILLKKLIVLLQQQKAKRR